MVDRIEKTLLKIPDKDRRRILSLLERIQTGRMDMLDLKKLKGLEHIYRVRKGSYRIIFSMKNRDSIAILAIERRSDVTYNHVGVTYSLDQHAKNA